MTETQLQRAIIQLAKLLGWYVYHVAKVKGQLKAETSVGFPDLVLVRGGRIIFVELKSAIGRVSKDQEEWLKRLSATKAEVWVWRPADWMSGAIEKVLK